MAFAVHTESYKGPIEKLLQLIEEKKLPITDVSLAGVTGDFLRYVEELQKTAERSFTDVQDDTENQTGVGVADIKEIIADFLVVAARLLLIKSRVLLPSLPLEEEEEEDIRDLETRLALYRELKPLKAHVRQEWSEVPYMTSRPFLASRTVFFMPPADISPRMMSETVLRVLGELFRTLTPVERVAHEVVHLKSKIEEVLRRITQAAHSFHGLRTTQTRSELVVLFLAVLHLVREQLVHAEQHDHFGDITIAKRDENRIQ